MGEKNKVLLAVASAFVVALAGLSLFLFVSKQRTEQEMVEMVEQMNYEKEQLEDEYMDVANQIEGVSIQISNDSLNTLLEKEQRRVQSLLEELRTVKATNARRISELKAELASVRKVLVYYISQVDSLSTVNQALIAENTQVIRQYNEKSREAETLAQEKQELTEKVSIASQLEARDVEVELLNSRGRKTDRVGKLQRIAVSYTILKNITAPVGGKTIYMRIATPDNSALQKNPSDTFSFENTHIAYSAKKNFEYAGEELRGSIYYNVTETLLAGGYRVDLFVDGHIIATANFSLR